MVSNIPFHCCCKESIDTDDLCEHVVAFCEFKGCLKVFLGQFVKHGADTKKGLFDCDSNLTKFSKRYTSQSRKHSVQSNTKFLKTAGFRFILVKTRFPVVNLKTSPVLGYGNWMDSITIAAQVNWPCFRSLANKTIVSPKSAKSSICWGRKSLAGL